MTDERRSLYERAAAAADAGEIAAPERRPTLRTEETYVTDENIIEQAIRGQREAWAELEDLRAENERLRAALDYAVTDDPMDIASRLRRIVREGRGYTMHQRHCLEAADEIEQLRGVQRAVVALARVVMASGNPMTNKAWIDVIHMMDDEARRD